MEDDIKQEWINKFIIDLKNITESLKKIYINNWALTGSGAIFYLLYKYNLINKYKIIPSDIDILTSSNELININKLDKFNRVQNTPEKSVTFLRSNINLDHVIYRIDISITPNINYITIDDINIIDPNDILKSYKEYINDPDRNKIKDKTKIKILEDLIKEIRMNYIVKKINAKEESRKKYKDYYNTPQKLKNQIEINNNTSQQLIDNISRKLFLDD